MAKNKKEMEALNDENLKKASGGNGRLTSSEVDEELSKQKFVGSNVFNRNPNRFKNGFQK